MVSMKRLKDVAANLIFPCYCKLCGGAFADVDRSLCSGCAALLSRERRTPACPRCAGTVGPFEIHEGRCRRCRGRRPVIVGTARVSPYAEHFARLIRSYKYHGRVELGPLMGEWLAEAVESAPWRARLEAIVAVPTHWRHRLGRPLYAAEALAGEVARRTGIWQASVLRRVRGGPHQIGLSQADRAANVRGAFALRRGASLDGARLVLVDDVKTTGATLKECANALRRGGAAEVYAAVVVTVPFDESGNTVISSI